ncbi:unnamed protein product [Blepharisma stoltei]|uniref:Uncharacterized protein n=1 Tax=Blepharisma stoltei TaxID=1481888 RepID=A0AAU9ISA4_9CILI|nr:unnamed protein product [Blepharisma stoltei]
MFESSNRSHSNPPIRDRTPQSLAQDTVSLRKQLNQKEYELYQRERATQLQDIENSQTVTQSGDRAQLMKRINALLIEVDKLNQDKQDLINELHSEKLHNEELQRKMKHSGKVKSVVDRNMQSDLKFEKEENNRLRHLLHTIEIERAELRSKLKDFEIAASSFGYEKQEYMAKLQQKIDHIAILEADNRMLTEKINIMQGKISTVEDECTKLMRERAEMRENISILEGEKGELNIRMHDEAVRMENYQISKNNETENMKWIHKRHCRLLASRNICKELERIVARRLNSALSEMSDTLKFCQNQVYGVGKIVANFEKCNTRMTKRLFDKWRGSLGWTNVQAIRLNLVEKLGNRGVLSKFFADWRTNFLYQQRCKQRHGIALSLIYKAFGKSNEHSVRARFLQWKYLFTYNNHKNLNFNTLAFRIFKGKIKHAFEKWTRFTDKMRFEQAKEDLSTDFAAVMLKGAYFRALKDLVFNKKYSRNLEEYQQQQADKLYQVNILHEMQRYTQNNNSKRYVMKRMMRRWTNKDLAKGFHTWKKEIKQKKTLDRLYKYFGVLDNAHMRTTKQKLFYAWKSYKLTQKLKAASDELAVEKPKRLELEQKLSYTHNESLRNSQIKVGRVLAKRFNVQVSSYFYQWKQVASTFYGSLPRVKKMLVYQYMGKLGKSFRLWKRQVINEDIIALCRKNEDTMAENSALAEHINNLEYALQSAQNDKNELVSKRMRNVILTIKNREISAALRAWARNALHISNVENAGHRLEKKLRELIFYQALDAIMAKSIAHKQQEAREKRLAHYVMIRWRNWLNTTFDAWKDYSRILQAFRRQLKKSQSRANQLNTQYVLSKWKNIIKAQKLQENINLQQNLKKNISNLSKALENKTQEHDLQVRANEKLSKNLRSQCRRRIIMAFLRCSQGSRRIYFDRWRDKIALKDSQIHHSDRLLRLWNKIKSRQAWRNWLQYIKRKIIHYSEEEITIHVAEKKQMKREHKGVRAGFQQQLKERENVIKTQQDNLGKKEQLVQFLLERGVKQFESEYSENKAAFAFKAMKDRFMRIKNTMASFTRRIEKMKMRKGLKKIKHAASENQKINSLRDLLLGAFKRYGVRYMKNAFDNWHRNAHKRNASRLETELANESSQHQILKSTHQAIRSRNRTRTFIQITNRTKKNLFDGWFGVVCKTRAIARANIKFQNQSKLIKLGFAVGQWYGHRDKALRRKHRDNIAAGNYMKIIISRIFGAWKRLHYEGKYLTDVFKLVGKRYYRDSISSGMAAIKSYAIAHAKHHEWNDRVKSGALARRLFSKTKTILGRGFRKWAECIKYREKMQHRFKGVLIRAWRRKLRRAWQLWEEHFVIKSTVEVTNKEGSVAIDNEILRNRVDILNQLITDEGIDRKYVENYILEREDLKSAIKRKKVNRLRMANGKENSSQDGNLAARMFLIWKMWVIKRKKIKRVAIRMQAYKRKGEVMKAFLTWKKGFPLVVNTVNKLTRRELYSLIAKMDRDLKTIEGKLENNHKDVVYLQTYANILQNNVRKGQNLALSLCNMNTHKSLFRGMIRWIMHTNLCKVHDLLSQLTSTEEQLFIIKSHLRGIEDENKSLIDENMELRQASLDGIAIADAFETLTKEREKLSVDLADRAATIKRLLEQNSQLMSKLKKAGLDESYATPERDFPKNVRY